MSEKPREEKKVDASRRAVIAAIGGLAVGGVVGYLLAPRAPPETVTQTVPTTTTVPVTTTVTQTVTATTTAPPPQPVAKYPRAKLANISELQPKRPVTKQYAGVNFRRPTPRGTPPCASSATWVAATTSTYGRPAKRAA
jgi:hypothetical protein